MINKCHTTKQNIGMETTYHIQSMILFCLLPTFSNQNSKIWTHKTVEDFA